MTVLRGEIWLAELNPIRGSEQAGTRPVLVMQTNAINRFTTTSFGDSVHDKFASCIFAVVCSSCGRRRRLVERVGCFVSSVAGVGQNQTDEKVRRSQRRNARKN